MQVLGNRLDALRRRFPSVGTVRLRLTALYGSLFLVSGAGLLAITYVLVYHATASSFETRTTATTRTPGGAPVSVAQSHAADLHQLLVQSGIALAIMTVASAVLGWLVAGRVLAPLRTMTEATRRISEDNLHDRLALSGPNDELKALADTIDGLLERLEAAFDAQRRFVANASHELRTPLAGMRASLDVAIAKPGPLPPQLVTLDDRLRTVSIRSTGCWRASSCSPAPNMAPSPMNRSSRWTRSRPLRSSAALAPSRRRSSTSTKSRAPMRA